MSCIIDNEIPIIKGCVSPNPPQPVQPAINKIIASHFFFYILFNLF